MLSKRLVCACQGKPQDTHSHKHVAVRDASFSGLELRTLRAEVDYHFKLIIINYLVVCQLLNQLQ